jgi:hypothetical protein
MGVRSCRQDVTMDKSRKRLIRAAVKKHGRILPCTNCLTLSDSFTQWEGRLVLWFNTRDNTTHALAYPQSR